MKKIIFLLLTVVTLLVGCTTQTGRHETIERAKQLMNEYPDSALALLDSLLPYQGAFSKSMRMDFMMQRLNAQNKCDTIFRSDSIAKILVDYYSHHGTSNQRMLANYLAGRVYYDMGELPHALHCYQNAIEVADTTRSDCDLYTLYAVYGQMAELFHAQFLPDDEMEALKAAEQCAWKDRDTLSALAAFNLRAKPYYLKNENDSVLIVLNHTRDLYTRYGHREMAARTLCTIISVFLDRGKYAEAHELMCIYEEESGLFDADGNIMPGREMYYYEKGRYALFEDKTDSATLYFTKLLKAKLFEAGYKGLLQVYKKRNEPDSVVKYASLYTAANDSSYLHVNQEAIHQISAMYNYQKYKQAYFLSEQGKQKAIAFSSILLIVLVASLIFGGYRYIVIEKEARLRFERLQLMEKEHRQKMTVRENASSNPLNEEMISVPPMEVIRETSIYKRIHELQASEDLFEKKLTPEEWKELEREINVAWPLFEDKLYSLYPNLNARQLQVCLLTKIEMKPKMVAEFVQLTEQGVGSLKRRLYEKTFNKKGGTKDFDQSILLI